ncbi:hypothetical protein B6N25_06715 [Sphingobacteriales bacterium TSM_CSS]|nr:hypothetical protein B6N25_06715 [Sphingobacteriales bacterium TSM_CSS]
MPFQVFAISKKLRYMFKELFLPAASPGVTQSLIVILAVIGVGVFAGRLRVGKVSLGVSAVMFTGLLFGHAGYRIQPDILVFIRDFGLILFVYGIGIQVGPSFSSSFRKEGLIFNALAAGTVLLGVFFAWLVHYVTHTGIENTVGLMSGAVTNTPGLGAAKSLLQEIQNKYPQKTFADPAIAYAITYPLGVLGIIAAIIGAKTLFAIDATKETQLFEQERSSQQGALVRKKCRVLHVEVIGKSIYRLLKENDLSDLIISRIKHSGSTVVNTPTLDMQLRDKDVMVIVGKPKSVERFIALVGKESTDSAIESEQDIITKSIFVTRQSATHKKLSELDLFNRYGLKVTRVYRSGMELLASPSLELYYGDKLRVVGSREDIEEVEKMIGNSEKRLLEPDFLSLFGGLIIGIALGSVPIVVPALPVPVKLGFAAGPLLAALFISRYGGIGVIHSYINAGAIYFMKDLGICLFFAAVGVHAGEKFYQNFIHYNGWNWLMYGSLITFVPLLAMVIVGRLLLKLNFLQLSGIMSGAYTDPAALAFSTAYFDSDVPSQAYATVYPLVTILRIFSAQILILLLI